MKVYIYTLTDPSTNLIRYVGKSVNPKERLSTHINSSKFSTTHVANWIKSLIKQGLIPTMGIVEQCYEENWIEREKYWIKFYKETNELCNIHEGGGTSKPAQRGKGLGYYYDNRINKWIAKGSYYGQKYLGTYTTENEAKQAYITFNENPTTTLERLYNKGVKMYKDGQLVQWFDSIAECAIAINTNGTNISRCCKGKAKTHKGYTFTH